jgi:hypothetical protein
MSQLLTLERLDGSCHCGALRFAFDWPAPARPIPVRACGCGFCTRHGAVWTAHPQGRFALDIRDEGLLRRYRFGTRTADVHLCLGCGVAPVVTSVIGGRRYAVVNVNTFDGVDRGRFVEQAVNFEGESTEDRLARRARNWTPEAQA